MTAAVREKWTDERLDDLNGKVDDGFADMRAGFRAVRGVIAASQRLMIQLMHGLFATMIFGFTGLILDHI